MRSIFEEIEHLRKMATPELLGRYREVYGREPRVKHREWLWKRIAWRIQERRLGGLSELAKQRLEELIAELDLPTTEQQRVVAGTLKEPAKRSEPKVGVTLVRTWHGNEIRVQVLESGYEHDGIVYASLSAVAKAVTGTHWNGRLFFGLTRRKKAK